MAADVLTYFRPFYGLIASLGVSAGSEIVQSVANIMQEKIMKEVQELLTECSRLAKHLFSSYQELKLQMDLATSRIKLNEFELFSLLFNVDIDKLKEYYSAIKIHQPFNSNQEVDPLTDLVAYLMLQFKEYNLKIAINANNKAGLVELQEEAPQVYYATQENQYLTGHN